MARKVRIKPPEPGRVPYDDINRVHVWTQEAKDKPRVGDSFQEMYSYWVWIAAIVGDHVHWEESTGKRGRCTKAEWREKHRYGSIPGYSVMLHTRGAVG